MVPVDEYVGLPYLAGGRTRAAIDCWGLCRLVYWERLRIRLPSYSGYELARKAGQAIGQMIREHLPEWCKVSEPQPYDLVLITLRGQPHHIGIYIGDGRMLHAYNGRQSCIEPLSRPEWARRIEGYYRVR